MGIMQGSINSALSTSGNILNKVIGTTKPKVTDAQRMKTANENTKQKIETAKKQRDAIKQKQESLTSFKEIRKAAQEKFGPIDLSREQLKAVRKYSKEQQSKMGGVN